MSSPPAGATEDGHAGSTGGPVDTGNTFLGDVRVNAKRWVWKTVENPTSVLIEVATAIFSLLLFAAVFGDVGEFALESGGFGDVGYITFLLPAALLQATMGSAFSTGIGLVDDLESGMFAKTTVTPMSATAVFAGKAIADMLSLVVPLVVVTGLGYALGASIETGLLGWLGILLICLLVGLLFMAVSNLIGLLTRDEEALNAATMLFMFPLLFLSPAFLPLSALPSSVETLATFNPITYGIDAVRALVLGRDVMTVVEVTYFGGMWDTVVPAVGVLLVWTIVCGAIAVRALSGATSTSVD